MTYNIRLFSSATLALALGAGGCSDSKDNGGSGDTEAGTTGGGATMDDGPGMTNTGTPGDDSGSATSGMTTTPMTDDGMMTATVGPMTDDGTPPAPNGGMCTEDADCESMQCYDGGLLGGLCGECNEDVDCKEGGCSVPNPLTMSPSLCNMGELGGGCETSDVCMDGLVCALILDVPGVITASTCSECETDADCTDQLCAPSYDVMNISGQKTCVDAGSIENGNGCDLEGSGSESCLSTFCAPADVMGFLELGVCSECLVDDDCTAPQVCMPAAVDLATGLIAATCVDP